MTTDGKIDRLDDKLFLIRDKRQEFMAVNAPLILVLGRMNNTLEDSNRKFWAYRSL